MSLFTKCILKEREGSDGVRISVMSRHTLEDGVTPDLRITPDKFDEHLPELAPAPKLIGDYYKRGLTWEEFEVKYLSQIRSPRSSDVLKSLIERALREDITLLCIELTPERCHRRLLAEECSRLNQNLVIDHR